MIEHKILFTGTTGAGKTTAIRAVSEVRTIDTDVRNTDPDIAKAMTTAGMDYGELTLAGGEKLRLYGTPGQHRFDFMWGILARGALGLVILVDNSQPDPLGDLDAYVEGFRDLIQRQACVVGIGRMETHPEPSVDAYALRLESRGVLCPVLPTDVRHRENVVELLEVLLLQLEAKSEESRP